MHPISFAKAHPVAVITNMALGMAIGPWVLGMINRNTGVNVSIPTYGNGK
jgi:hypothetical protein